MRSSLRAAALLMAAFVIIVPRALAGDEDKVDPAYEKKILGEAAKIEKAVERIRGLKFQAPVRKGVQSEGVLKKEILAEFGKPENQGDLENEAKIARAFGFVTPEFNWKDEQANLLAEQIAGFYDNESKRLRLVQKKSIGMSKEMQDANDETVMAHELQHALQDQTFDLGRWFSVVEGHRDRITAWKCVVEGEATFLMIKYMMEKQAPGMEVPDLRSFMDMNKGMQDMVPGAKEQAEKLAKLPKFLVMNLTMPYEDGAIFVQKVYDKGGWDAVTKLFQDPPSSTQQVLHPKKFFDRIEPVEICMPSVAKALKGKAIEQSTLGELNVRILLESHGVKEKTAKKLAAGWKGDHYQAVDVDGKTVLAWLSVWEDAEKATAFADAMRPALEKRRAGKFSLVVKDAQVVLVDGDDADLRDKAERRAWASVLQDGHLKALPSFFEKPPVTDFTKEDTGEGFGRATGFRPMGDRIKDDELGISYKIPTPWKKVEDSVKELRDFSRGCWQTPQGGEMRILDLPMPFDKENLTQQFEALVRKGTREFKKVREGERTVAGHSALEVEFEGIIPDGTNQKRSARAVAVERESVTLLFLLTAPHGKLAEAIPPFDASLESLQFAGPRAMADEKEYRSLQGRHELVLSTGGTWKQLEHAERKHFPLTLEGEGGARIQAVASRAPREELEAERA